MEHNNQHTFVILAYKESSFLENCIKSVKNQKYKSKVIIATTTPNKYINKLANKYNLKVVTNKHTNIGGDFNFALNAGKTKLITIAHQDDVYEKEYSEEIVKAYKQNKNAQIIFTNYFEIRNNKIIKHNINLATKSILLQPLKLKKLSKFRFIKRLTIRFGDSICCPAVSFNINLIPNDLFLSNFKSNVDWLAWEKLSNKKGKFIYINKKLMGHRISEQTETTKIINSGIRTNEDFEILKLFWPKPIAKFLSKIYQLSEISNK